MNSRSLLHQKKDNILQILSSDDITPEQKLQELELDELFETISNYETELEAQNQELLDKDDDIYLAKEEFQTLFEFSPTAYFKLDANLYITKLNNSAKYLFKNSGSILTNGVLFGGYIYKEDFSKFIRFTLDMNKDHQSEIKLRMQKDDILLHAHIKMEKIVERKETYFLVSVLDITKEIEQQKMILTQAKNVAMGEMLSMITHQWKQPLSSVLSLNTMMHYILDEDQFNKELFKQYLIQIEEQVEYMDQTIYDFKNFFNESNEIITLNISDCVERAIKFTRASLKKADIQIDVEYVNNPILSARGHYNDVCQILINIINNAKDELIHTKDIKRWIKILISNKNDSIVCKVQNNGGMIGEDLIESVFNKNFTTKAHDDGSGLGLYMSNLITKEHLHGNLSVKNISKEVVEFCLEIPIYIDKGKDV